MSRVDQLERWQPEIGDICKDPEGSMCEFYPAKKIIEELENKVEELEKELYFRDN